jgi:uncharacterized protein YciI
LAAPNWACLATPISPSSDKDKKHLSWTSKQRSANSSRRRCIERFLYALVSEPAASHEKIVPHIPDHLRHLVAMEKSSVLFASAPFLEAGQVGLRSTMIIRAKDLAEACSSFNSVNRATAEKEVRRKLHAVPGRNVLP